MPNIAFSPNRAKHDIIDRFLNQGSPKEIEKEIIRKCQHLSEPKKNIFSKYYKSAKSAVGAHSIDDIANQLAKKKNVIETFLIEAILVSIIKELHGNKNFTKAGVDYKNDNLFFWFIVKDEDEIGYNSITEIISKYNKKFATSRVKINYTIVDEFSGLDIPPDYRELKII